MVLLILSVKKSQQKDTYQLKKRPGSVPGLSMCVSCLLLCAASGKYLKRKEENTYNLIREINDIHVIIHDVYVYTYKVLPKQFHCVDLLVAVKYTNGDFLVDHSHSYQIYTSGQCFNRIAEETKM